RVVYASARSNRASAPFLSLFQPDVYIGYGGALATEGERVICRFSIPAEVSDALIADCLDAPEKYSVAAINERLAVSNNKTWLALAGNAHYTYDSFQPPPKQSFLKISVNSKDPRAVESLAAKYPALTLFSYTGEDFYQLTNREAVKWNAVKKVLEHYDISARDAAAFGDDLIDIEMLCECGAGVAMANAIGEVKAAARFVCGSNDDDGVARWLAENVLR
ncbi:MAG: HAD family hydrolase, partial [Defluviitaleaceae bacterium]|nr:HAD family hydrolase [Defluviitaleaceae bacterium]